MRQGKTGMSKILRCLCGPSSVFESPLLGGVKGGPRWGVRTTSASHMIACWTLFNPLTFFVSIPLSCFWGLLCFVIRYTGQNILMMTVFQSTTDQQRIPTTTSMNLPSKAPARVIPNEKSAKYKGLRP